MEPVLIDPVDVGAVPADRVEVDTPRRVEQDAFGFESLTLAGGSPTAAAFAQGAGAIQHPLPRYGPIDSGKCCQCVADHSRRRVALDRRDLPVRGDPAAGNLPDDCVNPRVSAGFA